MATRSVTTCDVCGAVKGEVNHWYRAQVDDVVMCIYSAEAKQCKGIILKDFCGQGCLNKWISENLQRLIPKKEETKENANDRNINGNRD